jgi:hypothetical protein
VYIQIRDGQSVVRSVKYSQTYIAYSVMEQPEEFFTYSEWAQMTLQTVKCIREISSLKLHPVLFERLMKFHWQIEMGERDSPPVHRSLHCFCLPPVHFDGFDEWFDTYRNCLDMSCPCDLDHWML